jgi:hypothetical protein
MGKGNTTAAYVAGLLSETALLFWAGLLRAVPNKWAPAFGLGTATKHKRAQTKIGATPSALVVLCARCLALSGSFFRPRRPLSGQMFDTAC